MRIFSDISEVVSRAWYALPSWNAQAASAETDSLLPRSNTMPHLGSGNALGDEARYEGSSSGLSVHGNPTHNESTDSTETVAASAGNSPPHVNININVVEHEKDAPVSLPHKISKKDLVFALGNAAFYALPVSAIFGLTASDLGEGNEPLRIWLFSASCTINFFSAVQLVFSTKDRFVKAHELKKAVVHRYGLEDTDAFIQLMAFVRYETAFDACFLLGVFCSAITVAPGVPFSDEGLASLCKNTAFRVLGNTDFAINTATTRFVGGLDLSYGFYEAFLMRFFQPDRYALLQIIRLYDGSPLPMTSSGDLDITKICGELSDLKAKKEQRKNSLGQYVNNAILLASRLVFVGLALLMTPLFINLSQEGWKKLTGKSEVNHGLVILGGIANAAFYSVYSYRVPERVAGVFSKYVHALKKNSWEKSAVPLTFMLLATVAILSLFSGGGYAQVGDQSIQPTFKNITNFNVTTNTTVNQTQQDPFGHFGSVANQYWLSWAAPAYEAFATPLPFFRSIYGLLCMFSAGAVNFGMALGVLLGAMNNYEQFQAANITDISFLKVLVDYVLHCFQLNNRLPKNEGKNNLENGRVNQLEVGELKSAFFNSNKNPLPSGHNIETGYSIN